VTVNGTPFTVALAGTAARPMPWARSTWRRRVMKSTCKA
jgi:hypothetical protein